LNFALNIEISVEDDLKPFNLRRLSIEDEFDGLR